MIGLKRIGIILSVLWIVVGGLWTRGMVIDDLGKLPRNQFPMNQHIFCLEHGLSGKDCDAEFHAHWQRDVMNVEIDTENAVFTFGPLLLAWVLFCIIARLTRWVAAGFRQERKLSNSKLT
jgi:hypothetical protein